MLPTQRMLLSVECHGSIGPGTLPILASAGAGSYRLDPSPPVSQPARSAWTIAGRLVQWLGHNTVESPVSNWRRTLCNSIPHNGEGVRTRH